MAAMRLLATLSRRLRAYRDETKGSVIVLAAVLIPVIVGGLGLWVETGYWHHMQRKVQHAADMAAEAAAVRLRAGDSLTRIRTNTARIATASGLLASGQVTVNIPPTSGAKAGAVDAVEVILTEDHPRWFTAIYAGTRVTLAGRAVAVIEGGATACMLALSPSATSGIAVSGSTNVVMDGCDLAANAVSASAYDMGSGGSALKTGCIYTVGGAVTTGGLTLTGCPAVKTNSAASRDPYRSVAEPALWGPCRNGNVGKPSTTETVTPADLHPNGMKSIRFCNGLDIKGTVNLAPGLYIVEGGGLTINGGTVGSANAAAISGTGVTFLMAPGAEIKLNGNVTINLAAPTTGPTSGILFFGSRNSTGMSHVINGNNGSVLQGAIYTPTAHIQFSGNSAGTNGCTQVIASTITMTGNSTLKASCALSGTKDLKAGETVRIVE